jgi:hypothetical protein
VGAWKWSMVVGGLALALVGGLWAGSRLAGGSPETAGPGIEATDSPDTTTAPIQETDATNAPANTVVDGSCDLPAGEAFVGGPSTDLIDLGEVNGMRVEGAVYPRPDYTGEPWTMWGQGIALADGRFISAIGDHIGPDGNSFIYEYDPNTGTLATLGDLLSYVDHTPGSWGYGKVHGQMVNGPCGEVYFASYWGTNRDLVYDESYRGDVLFRLDPDARTMAALQVPVEEHGIPSVAAASDLGLVYGEAIDPVLESEDLDAGPFFVYDVVNEQVVFEGPAQPHVGFRNVMVDGEGRAYYSVDNSGGLAVYDPQSNDIQTHPHQMPGPWLRASTAPAPDGRVFAVTREPDVFFVLNPDGTIESLGSPAEYTATMAIHPDGDRFFFMPDAHGDAWAFGGALTSVDTNTGEQTVIAELNPLAEEGLGWRLGGTFGIAVAPAGDKIYIGANAGPLGADDGFGEVVLLVVHLQ